MNTYILKRGFPPIGEIGNRFFVITTRKVANRMFLNKDTASFMWKNKKKKHLGWYKYNNDSSLCAITVKYWKEVKP